MALLFLEEGRADPWLCDQNNVSALHLAAYKGLRRVVDHIMGLVPPGEEAAILLQRDANLSNPLHYACFKNRTEVALQLLSRFAHHNLLDLQNKAGATALHHACRHGNMVVAERLVRCGASLEIKDRKNQTCFDLLARWEDRQWLRKVACVAQQRPSTLVSATSATTTATTAATSAVTDCGGSNGSGMADRDASSMDFAVWEGSLSPPPSPHSAPPSPGSQYPRLGHGSIAAPPVSFNPILGSPGSPSTSPTQ